MVYCKLEHFTLILNDLHVHVEPLVKHSLFSAWHALKLQIQIV